MNNTELNDIIYLFVYNAIRELFPRTRSIVITPKTSFKDDLNLDSLDSTDFLLYIEEHFGKSIFDDDNIEEKEKFRKAMLGTIQDIVKFLIDITEQKGLKWV